MREGEEEKNLKFKASKKTVTLAGQPCSLSNSSMMFLPHPHLLKLVFLKSLVTFQLSNMMA